MRLHNPAGGLAPSSQSRIFLKWCYPRYLLYTTDLLQIQMVHTNTFIIYQAHMWGTAPIFIRKHRATICWSELPMASIRPTFTVMICLNISGGKIAAKKYHIFCGGVNLLILFVYKYVLYPNIQLKVSWNLTVFRKHAKKRHDFVGIQKVHHKQSEEKKQVPNHCRICEESYQSKMPLVSSGNPQSKHWFLARSDEGRWAVTRRTARLLGFVRTIFPAKMLIQVDRFCAGILVRVVAMPSGLCLRVISIQGMIQQVCSREGGRLPPRLLVTIQHGNFEDHRLCFYDVRMFRNLKCIIAMQEHNHISA